MTETFYRNLERCDRVYGGRDQFQDDLQAGNHTAMRHYSWAVTAGAATTGSVFACPLARG